MSDDTGVRRVLPLAAAVLVLIAIGLAVLSVVFENRVRAAKHVRSAQQAAVHAARQVSVDLVTLDYRHVDTDVRNVLAGATGDFSDQYVKDAPKVKEVVTANQVSSTGNVLESGVVSGDTDSVTVLVVVDSVVRNKANQTGQLRHYRVQLEMSLLKGVWRARSLQFVS